MFKNVFGFSFYALDINQVSNNLLYDFGKAEAILFSRKDLEERSWNLAWKNIEKVVKMIGSENVSFHFPMDDCNYFKDSFVKNRLIDALDRANSLKIKKIIIHPNIRYAIKEWQYINRTKMQRLLYQTVSQISKIRKYNTKLCLENMPPIGNKYDDADSSILFIDDFKSNMNYTLDICHYFNVVKTMKETRNEKKWKNFLPEIKECNYFDFLKKLEVIQHFHFSAFDDIANPFNKHYRREGILPNESVVKENYYKKAMRIIYENAIKSNKSIIFEISESDYTNRKRIFDMLAWAKQVVLEV